MTISRIAVCVVLAASATSASAQSVTSRVTGAVAGVTGSASTSVGAGAGTGSSVSNPYAALGDTSAAAYGNGLAGGEVPGGMGVRVGGKT
jgi:hypothetical protein